jgi:hypothetical protein
VADRDTDCPLGALVLDGDPAAWFRSARRLLEADARAIEPVLLGAVVDCAVRRRLSVGCPLVRVESS